MGRYYDGDIEGKFWFAIQDSTDADFFGGRRSQLEHSDGWVKYTFEGEDLNGVKKGLAVCNKELGEYREKLKEFFSNINGYNNEMIMTKYNLKDERVRELLEWYARRELGIEIRDCIKKNGSCRFTAEL